MRYGIAVVDSISGMIRLLMILMKALKIYNPAVIQVCLILFTCLFIHPERYHILLSFYACFSEKGVLF